MQLYFGTKWVVSMSSNSNKSTTYRNTHLINGYIKEGCSRTFWWTADRWESARQTFLRHPVSQTDLSLSLKPTPLWIRLKVQYSLLGFLPLCFLCSKYSSLCWQNKQQKTTTRGGNSWQIKTRIRNQRERRQRRIRKNERGKEPRQNNEITFEIKRVKDESEMRWQKEWQKKERKMETL